MVLAVHPEQLGTGGRARRAGHPAVLAPLVDDSLHHFRAFNSLGMTWWIEVVGETGG
jgi:hypothetical protein